MLLKKSTLFAPLATTAGILGAMAGGGLVAADKAGVANLSNWPIMIHNHWVKDVSTPGGIFLSVLRADDATAMEPRFLPASRRLRDCGYQTLKPGEIAGLSLPEASSATDAKASVTVLRIREVGGPAIGYAKLTITGEGKARNAVIEPFGQDAEKGVPSALCSAKEDGGSEQNLMLFFLGSTSAKAEPVGRADAPPVAAAETALPPEPETGVHVRFPVPDEPGLAQSATVR
jgi:hypothetical protein